MDTVLDPRTRLRRAALAAGVTLAVTVLCWYSRLGLALSEASYDLTFRFLPRRPTDGVVLVYMDEKSTHDLHQNPDRWSPSTHARLLEKLRRDNVRVVVLDVVFTDVGADPPGDQALAAELKAAGGRVVLAAARDWERVGNTTHYSIHAPRDPLADAAPWGIAGVAGGPGEVARRYEAGTAEYPPLPWVAAEAARLRPEGVDRADLANHWLNYAGPPNSATFRRLSYADALAQPPGSFTGLAVFVGAKPSVPSLPGLADVFATPYSRWGGDLAPGVDLAATAFLNLTRREWLRGVPDNAVLGVCGALALLGGVGAGFLRLRWVTAGACLLLAVLPGVGAASASHRGLWIPWLMGAVVLCPGVACSAFWALRGVLVPAWRRREMGRLSTVEAPRGPERDPVDVPGKTPPAAAAGPSISDHTLLRCIGRGGYGEVWIARDVIGTFHAVKLVHRASFPSEHPFEREFRGMQRYTPLSRNHPGWVHVLHVGRNPERGYFYYVMEPADDERSGQEIDPETYRPRTLASELSRRGRLPFPECLAIGIALGEALDYLHSHLLVHRDIKPSNVIFVHGTPKFTDVGLITEARNRDHSVSHLGTEGYIAPEGPGTAAADVYSLGKLLFEISTGSDRRLFPVMPDALLHELGRERAASWRRLLERACDADPTRRYQSAVDLVAALRALESPAGGDPAAHDG